MTATGARIKDQSSGTLKRVVLATGGTGGHIFPALAVAERLVADCPGCSILFLGGERGPEGTLVRDSGIPGLSFEALPAAGVLGRGLKSLQALAWMTRSLRRCLGILTDFRPQVVLGLGGYAGFVPVLTACLKRIPTAIHEQNSVLGLTNRILGRWVRKVFLSFSETENLPARARTVLTGNPVRQSILAIRHENEHSSSGQRRVLVLGGSQGAKGINEAVIQALPALRAAGFTLRHQTGEQDFEKVRQAYAERSLHGCVEPFIADMARAYSECDMVLCRAGATTLAELGVAGKPSLLVPFPYATGDHQTKNARAMERLGASMVISQNQLADLSLARILDDVFNLPGKLREMAVAAKAWGRPGAAADIVAELRRLAGIPV